jgi:hypothetical protein
MALVKCEECGTEVSDKAAQCPKCGAPPPKQFWNQNLGCGGLVLLLVFVYALWSAFSPSRDEPNTAAAACTPPTPEMQAKRDEIIAGLIREGEIYKVEPSSEGIMRAFVTDKFYRANVDDKRAMASVIWVRYFECVNDSGMLLLKDAKSGRKVGSFSTIAGFQMDE